MDRARAQSADLAPDQIGECERKRDTGSQAGTDEKEHFAHDHHK
jgi:hypothetical protein